MTPAPARTPNYTAFLLTGAVLGLLLGLYLGSRDPGGPSYIPGQMLSERYSGGAAAGFLGIFGALVGAGVGGLLAILLERLGRRGS